MEFVHQLFIFLFAIILLIASTEAGASQSRESSSDYNSYGNNRNEDYGGFGNRLFGEESGMHPPMPYGTQGGMQQQMPYGMNGGTHHQMPYGMQGGMHPPMPYGTHGGMQQPMSYGMGANQQSSLSAASRNALAQIAQPGTVINGIDHMVGRNHQATVVSANLHGANPTVTVQNQSGTVTLTVVDYEL